MKILVAEDDANLAELYREAIHGRGHQVDFVHNGEECVTKFIHSNPYDAVILDIKMPQKNGLDTAKDILELAPNQRILFVSGYIQETLTNSLSPLLQIVTIIQKPFEFSKLINVLEDLESYSKMCTLNLKVKNLDSFDPMEPEVSRLLDELIKKQKPDVWYALGHIIIC